MPDEPPTLPDDVALPGSVVDELTEPPKNVLVVMVEVLPISARKSLHGCRPLFRH